MIVSWLLSRLQKGEGAVEINKLHEIYKFECLESGSASSSGIRPLTEFLVKLFPEVKKQRKQIGKSNATLYVGVFLKDSSSSYNTVEFSCISSYLTECFTIKKNDSVQIFCELKTGHFMNGNEIIKEVTFNIDKTWQLKVAGKDVDMEKVAVNPIYEMTQVGIKLVCDIVKLVKCCLGVEVSGNVVVTRFHTLEQYQDSSNVKLRILRSLSCKRILAFNAQCVTCVTCQKMTFKHASNERKVFEDKTNSQSTTLPSNIKETFRELIPGASEAMLELLNDQSKNSNCDPRGRRWSKSVISTCLQLYSRSPHGYEAFRNSGILLLPSPSLLILYKNAVKQQAGIQTEIYKWMYEECQRRDIPESGLSGGLIFDEMAIQSDLQISKEGDVVELTGFADIGHEGNLTHIIRHGTKKLSLGSHILQIVFLGFTGFRFPVAHFVTNQIQGTELYSLFWAAVNAIERFRFKVFYTSMDGAQCNRTFMHINIDNCLTSKKFTVLSSCSLRNMTFIMDYSHVIKKIRNSVLSSGFSKAHTRLLTLANGHTILWQMFRDAYDWDKQNCLSLHRKLTDQHIILTSHDKMRNYLAEEILNADMLHLMIEYQNSLGNKGEVLQGAIELLQQTSVLIDIFRDTRPIKHLEDTRLLKWKSICKWFEHWKLYADNLSEKNRYRKVLSLQCHEDIIVELGLLNSALKSLIINLKFT